MDLNKNLLLPLECELKKNENVEDTTLCLNWTGFRESNSARYGCKQSNFGGNLPNASDDSCRLVLGLGPTPSTYSDEYYNFTTNRSKGLSPAPTQGLPSEDDSILQLDLSGGTKEVSTVIDYSVSSKMNFSAPYIPIQVSAEDTQLSIPVVDEGSTSAKISGGYMPSLLLAPKMDSAKFSLQTQGLLELGTKNHLNHKLCDVREYSISTISDELTTGLSSERRTSNPKKCRFFGCTKGARGSSGLCIGHGGGQRCQKPGCNKGSETRTIYCKAHGGGKRCQHLGCTKSAEGKTDYCIAHGGGRRCGHPGGCNKASRGRSGLCIRHGGGKRCKVEGCTRSAEGQASLCISHGGGRRCQHEGCTKGAQGSTMYCKAHGGGKRCIFRGCTKGAEGSTSLCKGHGGGKRCLYDGGGICPKSVHGGTNFCVAHGGGKRCAVPGCTKSARGRTDCCVRHGGGKRCKYENCGKSAQGSTDFCKAHGGGKRCTWGEDKCEKFARGKSGLCAAHSSKALERVSNKGGLVGPGLFHVLVSTSSTAGSSFDNNHSSIISVASDCIDSWENPAKRHQLIPPQVLVPQSMKSSSSFYSNFLSAEKEEGRNGYGKDVGSSGRTSLEFNIPEGRVHGGPLMSMFGGNLKNAIDGSF